MAKTYSLVVFDWEGTLGDTLGIILKIVGNVAEQAGLEKPEPERALAFAGYGLATALRKLYPDLTNETYDHLINDVQIALLRRQEDIALFPGAIELVETLQQRGIDLAIATNKSERALQRALEQTGLKPYFPVTRAAGQAAAKPDPEMLEQIMAVYGKSAEDCLMIGDSTSDILMAQQLQVDGIGVDFYHQQAEAMLAQGALAVFDNYQQVAEFIFKRET
ncbi:MAG: HAD-IA family hydrolase [Legionellaceae bacterium]|nr:HAD-IA family hydrolase [Legionellaceae bacterium]